MYESEDYVSTKYNSKKKAIDDANNLMKDWGHVNERHKYSVEIALDFTQLLTVIYSFEGCDDIKSMMDEALKSRRTYFYSHLSSFYRNNCLKKGPVDQR